MSRNPAAAVVLTSTIDSARIETLQLRSLLEPPAVRQEHRSYRAPLDLSADTFRYRVLPSGEIAPLRDDARHCFVPHRHPRRR
jgi:hypothetical protein